jgi:hypothetical protein
MGSKRKQHLGLCLLIAVGATVGSVLLDGQRSEVHQSMSGLQWARQVVSQVESMSLKGRENGEKDPITWAVGYLAQGVEPRLVHVNKIQLADNSPTTESYTLDRSSGLFDYTKILSPEDGAGIHVQLNLGYTGFLGAKSILASDLLALGLLLFSFTMTFFLTSRLFGFDDTYRIRVLVSTWVGGAKSQLTRLSVHIREMVRQSQRLAACAGKARDLVGNLRTSIHSGLNEVHESRQWFRDAEATAHRADGLALSVVIEANRMGQDAKPIADMATELHHCIEKMRALNKKSAALVARLEKKVEPWTRDVDQAFHAFDDVKDATDILSRHIRSTTETLIGQAKLIQSLHQDLGEVSVVTTLPSSTVAAAASSESGEAKQLPEPLPPIKEKVKLPRKASGSPLLRKISRFKKSA